MPTLVFIEHHDGEPLKPSLGVLSKAATLWDDTAAVLCGSGVAALAERVGACGAKTVFIADDAALADPLPQALVLTAIVISFATTALLLVVLIAARGLTGTDHVDGREPEE